MKAIQKKLLLASVAVGVLTGGIVHAKDVTPTESSSGNTVTVTDDDGTITATELDYMSVAAGYADEENTDASNNTLNIQGGTFNSPPIYMYGGYVSSSGNALYNKINISGGSISGTMQIYGGAVGLFGTGSGDAIGNEVTIGSGANFFSYYGSLSNVIYGGAGTNATNNKVYINGATVHGVIFGGGGQQNVTGNEVHINGGTIEGVITSDSTASSAVISGGLTVSNSDGSSMTEGTHTFSENKVYITDGTINAFISGAGGGGYNTSTELPTGTASNNEVNISGGTITGEAIEGAFSQIVEGNKINITGGTISSNIWAGIGETINNNEINIYNNPILTNSSLYGYDTYGDNSSHSGNTLNIYTKGLEAQNVYNFDNINFYLNSNINSGDTILELIGGSQTDVSSTDIQAVMQSGSPLTNGDTVTLLTNASGVTAAKSYTGTAAEGVSLTYPLTVYRNDEGTAILARLGSTSGTSSSSASNNIVTVTDSNYTINGTTTDFSGTINTVYGGTISDSGSFASDYIVGGYEFSGDSSNNTVNINSGTISTNIYGGYSTTGNLTNNTVYINNGSVAGIVHGGLTNSGDATGNKVIINGGEITATDIKGAFSFDGAANGNEVDINDGNFTSYTYFRGGDTWTGSASKNVVNVNGGNINGEIAGGYDFYANSEGVDVSENVVNINGGNILSGRIIGGRTWAGNAINNIVNLNVGDITINGDILGGESFQGTLSGNTLNVYNKNISAKNLYNFENINFYLPESTVNGDTILTLSESSTDISGAVVNAGVAGNANLNNGDTITLLTNAGTITDTGTTYGKLTEGVSLTYDLTVSKDGDNKIIATIGNTNSGSDTSGSDSSGTDSSAVDDSNNTVNLYSTNSGTIYGGYTDSGNASNNTVNLYSGTFENIYGGYAPNGETSNNTLNVYNKNISAQNLSNFSAMNFYIPNDASNGDTMLNLTDSAATDLSGVAIRAGVVAGNENLDVGDTINLLTNSNGFKTDSATSYGRLTEGVSLDYGLTVSNGGSNILATIDSVPQKLNSVTQEIPLGGGLTSIKTVDAILDNNTLPDIGLDFDFESDSDDDSSAAEISDVTVSEPKGWEIFASAGGGSLKTKAGEGAYVEMKSSAFDVGFARTLENGGAGKLVFAPIIDYAHGNYDSYLADGTHGTGSTKYIAGGGVFRNMWDNGFYVEGSFRAGKVRNDFASNDMDKTFGQRVSYDTKATAMAGHLKLGKNLRLNRNNLLDVYATYYHAHQGGMNADLNPYGDKYRISSANSGRFKIGYRMTTRTSKISRIYTGLAYQYEHTSGITANYLSKNLSTASTGNSGSSGMLELGWQIKPLKNNPWTVDINATGWVGHQRGVTAMAKVQKTF